MKLFNEAFKLTCNLEPSFYFPINYKLSKGKMNMDVQQKK